MNTSKTLLAIAALALGSAASAAPILTENFNNVGALPGWLLLNQSVPPGTGWFQGNGGVFPAHAGAADAYIAADFLSALNGTGTIDNWLISPVLNFAGLAQLSFFTRSQTLPGFNDTLEVRYHSGVSGNPADFTTVLAVIGGANPYPGAWQQFTAALTGAGSGRFAFRYVGDAATANYIGIDTVSLATVAQVPEPSTIALLALGLAALARTRRKQGQPH
jgi:hypothetical protein